MDAGHLDLDKGQGPRESHLCTMLRHIAPACLVTLLSVNAAAQNWTGALNSDWNNPGNWTDWPLDGEDVTIDPALYTGAQAAPEITSASVFSPDRMYVMNGAELVIEAPLSVGNRLIVSDDAQVEQGAGTLTTDRLVLELGGTYTLANGTVNTLGVLAFGDDGTQPSTFIQNGGTVNASGEFGFDLAVGPSAPRYVLNAGTLTVNGDALWFAVAPGSGSGHLEVNGGNATINGSLVNTVGSTMDLRVVLNGGTLTTNGPGITLAHGTDSIVLNGGAFHVDGNVVVGNDGVVHATGGDTYFDQQAELRGTGSYMFHNVTISGGATLQHTDPAEIAFAGTWIASGTFSPNTNTVAAAGAGPQTISGGTFHGLRVANTGGDVWLAGPCTVAGALTLEQGLVHTQQNDLLILLHGSTATAGSAVSHVDGPLQKVGNSAFVFPIGNNGTWRRLGISAINDQNTAYTAAYVAAPYANTTALGAGLIAVSGTEHWTLERSGATDDAQVELYWEDAAASGISDCATLSTCYWDGSAWQGLVSTTSGSCTGNDAGSVLGNSTVPVYTAVTFGVNDGTIGMAERTDAPHLYAFPNPAADHLWINGLSAQTPVQVLDHMGRVIHHGAAPQGLDVRSWAEGTYLLRYTLNGISAAIPVVVAR